MYDKGFKLNEEIDDILKNIDDAVKKRWPITDNQHIYKKI
jgi:hypothetical protein